MVSFTVFLSTIMQLTDYIYLAFFMCVGVFAVAVWLYHQHTSVLLTKSGLCWWGICFCLKRCTVNCVQNTCSQKTMRNKYGWAICHLGGRNVKLTLSFTDHIQGAPKKTDCFYCASICEGGLGSRNSVCLSVCLSHAWIVTKLKDALRIFWYHTKGKSLCYSDTNSGWPATDFSL